MRIIAVSGKAASGKDSYASALADALAGHSVVRIFPFAEELKKIASQLWGMDPEYLNTYEGKAAMRAKLIQLGGVVREIDPNTWVDIVIRKIKASANSCDVVVIPDLRFLNELYRLVSEFGTDVSMVRMSAPVDARMSRMGRLRAEDYVNLGIQVDASERQFDFIEQPDVRFNQEQLPAVQAIKAYASIVVNSGSLADLKEAVTAMLATILTPCDEAISLSAMRAAYRLAKQIGPEAKLVLAPELL